MGLCKQTTKLIIIRKNKKIGKAKETYEVLGRECVFDEDRVL
jgi:hypothetical protein